MAEEEQQVMVGLSPRPSFSQKKNLAVAWNFGLVALQHKHLLRRPDPANNN